MNVGHHLFINTFHWNVIILFSTKTHGLSEQLVEYRHHLLDTASCTFIMRIFVSIYLFVSIYASEVSEVCTARETFC